MTTRRQFLRLMLTAGAMGAVVQHRTADAASASSHQAYLPLVLQPADTHSGPWPNDEGWIVAGPSGRFDQAIAWFHARSTIYTHYDLLQIVGAYERIGNEAGVDWFLALAQCAHETGSLTSWWCDRPRRNPAGIAVTGAMRDGTPENPPGVNWAWDGTRWREGASFAAWDSFSVRAHLGRLLAYALPDWAATPYQRELIDYALAVRPLAAQIRGIAPTIIGLNGIWAVPGTEYGQRILDLARRMRQS
ncbi:glucosaminidase domain-containing protein [Candidatus Chloroploca sp. M-50]|uniref:Glucosaminidase domain-containing protein n=1 Tax=Candidatus Chloroploca mongolica TaxID=2528176 RepID=A0ABS4D805_9CHLR|nr:glucosaminidase domain-containing protein [Candidatus Chloroploca mongolica]MBP1465569.1 glucosaminidase domain-containing protein [Candidatus Chloroploca mongolica]